MAATSLRPLIEGAGPGREAALCEFTSGDRSRRGVCVRTERHKYAFWGRDEPGQFFDLAEDPLERHNAIEDTRYREEIERHRRLMLDRLMRTGQRPA